MPEKLSVVLEQPSTQTGISLTINTSSVQQGILRANARRSSEVSLGNHELQKEAYAVSTISASVVKKDDVWIPQATFTTTGYRSHDTPTPLSIDMESIQKTLEGQGYTVTKQFEQNTPEESAMYGHLEHWIVTSPSGRRYNIGSGQLVAGTEKAILAIRGMDSLTAPLEEGTTQAVGFINPDERLSSELNDFATLTENLATAVYTFQSLGKKVDQLPPNISIEFVAQDIREETHTTIEKGSIIVDHEKLERAKQGVKDISAFLDSVEQADPDLKQRVTDSFFSNTKDGALVSIFLGLKPVMAINSGLEAGEFQLLYTLREKGLLPSQIGIEQFSDPKTGENFLIFNTQVVQETIQDHQEDFSSFDISQGIGKSLVSIFSPNPDNHKQIGLLFGFPEDAIAEFVSSSGEGNGMAYTKTLSNGISHYFGHGYLDKELTTRTPEDTDFLLAIAYVNQKFDENNAQDLDNIQRARTFIATHQDRFAQLLLNTSTSTAESPEEIPSIDWIKVRMSLQAWNNFGFKFGASEMPGFRFLATVEQVWDESGISDSIHTDIGNTWRTKFFTFIQQEETGTKTQENFQDNHVEGSPLWNDLLTTAESHMENPTEYNSSQVFPFRQSVEDGIREGSYESIPYPFYQMYEGQVATIKAMVQAETATQREQLLDDQIQTIMHNATYTSALLEDPEIASFDDIEPVLRRRLNAIYTNFSQVVSSEVSLSFAYARTGLESRIRILRGSDNSVTIVQQDFDAGSEGQARKPALLSLWQVYEDSSGHIQKVFLTYDYADPTKTHSGKVINDAFETNTSPHHTTNDEVNGILALLNRRSMSDDDGKFISRSYPQDEEIGVPLTENDLSVIVGRINSSTNDRRLLTEMLCQEPYQVLDYDYFINPVGKIVV